MNWIQRRIYLYNVSFGLYMLDWWERCLFNVLVDAVHFLQWIAKCDRVLQEAYMVKLKYQMWQQFNDHNCNGGVKYLSFGEAHVIHWLEISCLLLPRLYYIVCNDCYPFFSNTYIIKI